MEAAWGLVRNETCHMSNSDIPQAFLCLSLLVLPSLQVFSACPCGSRCSRLLCFFPIVFQEFVRKLQKTWPQKKQETVLHPSSQPECRFSQLQPEWRIKMQAGKTKIKERIYLLPVSQKCSWQEMLLLELQWMLQLGVQQWLRLPHPMETTGFVNIENKITP